MGRRPCQHELPEGWSILIHFRTWVNFGREGRKRLKANRTAARSMPVSKDVLKEADLEGLWVTAEVSETIIESVAQGTGGRELCAQLADASPKT